LVPPLLVPPPPVLDPPVLDPPVLAPPVLDPPVPLPPLADDVSVEPPQPAARAATPSAANMAPTNPKRKTLMRLRVQQFRRQQEPKIFRDVPDRAAWHTGTGFARFAMLPRCRASGGEIHCAVGRRRRKSGFPTGSRRPKTDPVAHRHSTEARMHPVGFEKF